MTGLPAFEGATWHDSFARCPECGHATVGLEKPYGINHAAGCSMPPIPAGGSGERLLTEAECDRRIASHLGAMEADLCVRSGEAPAGLTERYRQALEEIAEGGNGAGRTVSAPEFARAALRGPVGDEEMCPVCGGDHEPEHCESPLRGPVGGEAGQERQPLSEFEQRRREEANAARDEGRRPPDSRRGAGQ